MSSIWFGCDKKPPFFEHVTYDVIRKSCFLYMSALSTYRPDMSMKREIIDTSSICVDENEKYRHIPNTLYWRGLYRDVLADGLLGYNDPHGTHSVYQS